MSTYMLLCNYTDQGVRTIREMPARREAARAKAKQLGVEIQNAWLALGAYDFILQLEARDEEAVAKYVLSLAAMGNLRTTTLRLFSESDYEKIVSGMV